ncbi:RICIN domain-containing protein [Kribbella sp. NPDC058245]|uniref:RICIN domain-containing protein n=1 Tax=Kribbella sp. NPDC058245 TaxID=3346399 RepID=UPI0036E1F65E
MRATDEAARTGRRVEVVDWRNETSEVYVNPTGSKTMTQHARPVRVHKGSGWAAPDASLRRQSDGTVQPVAAAVPMILSGGGDKTVLRIGKPGSRVTLGWPNKLPAPRISGDTATYPEVYRGVDLQIKVAVDNFSYLLVVKNRTAALTDAMRALRTPFVGDGLRLSVRRDGSTTAVNALGELLYTAPPPTMWDSTPAAPRHAKVGIRLQAGALELTPQRSLLTDPKAKFPIYIDPSLSGRKAGWLHVNAKMGNQTGWGYDTGQGAKVGLAYDDPKHNMYRSMFLMNTTNGAQTIAGSTISKVVFSITLDHSPTSTATPVDLWHLNDFTTGTYIDWANNDQFWHEKVAQRSAESYPPPEDKAVTFEEPRMVQLVQQAADERKLTIGFGLRAPNEGDQNQWKKFKFDTAVLSIEYNTAPREPKSLNMIRPRPCGTAQAPTAIATRTPQFSAVANDPDSGDGVTTTLEIANSANTVVYSNAVGPTATGAAFSWAEVPAGKLNENEVYHYRAFTRDAIVAGPATTDCYFVIDSISPDIPTISSTDFPDSLRRTAAYTTGTVTFRPAAGQENEVAEYVYGFLSDKLAMRVKAGAGGVATVPITLTPSAETGSFDRTLYVAAVDKAGNQSELTESWSLRALTGGTAPAPVRGDSNGDGRADLNAIFDQGFGRTAIWSMPSAGMSFHTGVMEWDTSEGGSFALTRTRAVQGDWNKDGKADMALLREGAGRQIWLYKLMSEGNRYDALDASWTSGANGWPLSTARVVSGDVDGDKASDIVVQNATANGGFEVLVFRAATNFTAPVKWFTSEASNQWTRSTPLLADINGDGKADFVSMHNLDGCRTSVEVFASSGSAFAAPATAYDSGAGAYCWEKSKAAVADPDGDGRDDIVAMYEDSPTNASLQVFKPSGSTLTRSTWWSVTNNDLDLSKTSLSVGDYNGDKKDDVSLLYAGGSTPGGRQAFTQLSTGTAFGARQQTWSGQVDAVTGPKFELEHRAYDLVSKNSNKCLNVEFASTNDDARFIQYQCLPVDLNARFRVDAIAGTDQYSARPMHSMKCADVEDFGQQDGAQLLQWPCGSGTGEPTANQQMTIEYIEGTSYDTVVQLRFAHSGKCATVTAEPEKNVTVFDDYAPIKQQTCGQLSTQQWTVRPSYNQTQLGENGNARYRIEAATSHNVLDIANCAATDDIRMWEWVQGSPCQSWKVESLGDDVYKIVDPSSNRALDIRGCSKLLKGSLIAFPSNKGECQRWRIEPAADGSFAVTSVSTGLSMDVDSCNPAAGTDVITWSYHGGLCQRWYFIKQ